MAAKLQAHGFFRDMDTMITYLDPVTGESRFKRRYVWAFWAFVAGILIGLLSPHII